MYTKQNIQCRFTYNSKISNTVTWGLGASTHELWGDAIQRKTPSTKPPP